MKILVDFQNLLLRSLNHLPPWLFMTECLKVFFPRKRVYCIYISHKVFCVFVFPLFQHWLQLVRANIYKNLLKFDDCQDDWLIHNLSGQWNLRLQNPIHFHNLQHNQMIHKLWGHETLQLNIRHTFWGYIEYCDYKISSISVIYKMIKKFTHVQ